MGETKRKCKSSALAGFVVLPALPRLGEEEEPNPSLRGLLWRGGRARFLGS